MSVHATHAVDRDLLDQVLGHNGLLVVLLLGLDHRAFSRNGTQCRISGAGHTNGTEGQKEGVVRLLCYFRAVTSRAAYGRPPATSHVVIEQAAFSLFDEHGFEATTMEDIAAAVGVGRRTLFRYYPSKNDILWGQFDEGLRGFVKTFAAIPDDVPIAEAVTEAIVAFNTLDETAIPQHRQRMRLLLGTPALLAHSELRYAAWRAVVADYVARRLTLSPHDLVPSLAGRIALSIALSAYEQWLDDERAQLADLIRDAGAAAAAFGRSAEERVSADRPRPAKRS
jgi:mycofactocin system transcriptional regulator